MVENNIKIINDLDIQIKDLEEEIQNAKSVNEKIKLNIQKKLLILKQLEAAKNEQEA